ncbi:hypothetical protein [Methanosarcina barkeri]|uniref:hypothetical protein n=1 Tax=Methanosarcina barkeri TaxID=2208 RepID=UPI000A7A03B0|nr:hypothetical protein [Methanosarcina barkeri]
MENLARIPEKIQAYFMANIRTYNLSKVLLDEEDAISTNQIFDCLKVIAEQYGVIVQECLAKGHNKEEITIKMEKADGTRTEKYITKTEIYTQLAEVGSEGIEIAGILGVDSRTQIKDKKIPDCLKLFLHFIFRDRTYALEDQNQLRQRLWIKVML